MKNGFTLTEIIMVIVIIGIIASISSAFILAVSDSWLFNRADRDVVFSARLTMNRMVREIRQATDTNSISTFTSTEFEFVDQNGVTINFQQSGSSLNRNSDELTNKLQNPGGLTFTYLDSAGGVAAVNTNIRLVRIKLVLTFGDSNVTIQSLSKLRNIN